MRAEYHMAKKCDKTHSILALNTQPAQYFSGLINVYQDTLTLN